MTDVISDEAEVRETTLSVTGMSCQACVRRVTTRVDAVTSVSGVVEPRHQYNWMMDTAENAAPVATLLENHRAFLRYLERRVGDRALAEDILQDAFAKLVARPEQAPADEAVVPWFYRTLRNAAIDQFRRRGAADRAYEAFARELDTHDAPSEEMQTEICACVSRLASTLKREYAEALTAIEVGGIAVKVFAEQKGLSANNAAVRVYRAREALKKRVTESCGTCAEHGCVNCTCRSRS
jgi:RNA polymerase sigma-70 factor (ECF subfamily)